MSYSATFLHNLFLFKIFSINQMWANERREPVWQADWKCTLFFVSLNAPRQINALLLGLIIYFIIEKVNLHDCFFVHIFIWQLHKMMWTLSYMQWKLHHKFIKAINSDLTNPSYCSVQNVRNCKTKNLKVHLYIWSSVSIHDLQMFTIWVKYINSYPDAP